MFNSNRDIQKFPPILSTSNLYSMIFSNKKLNLLYIDINFLYFRLSYPIQYTHTQTTHVKKEQEQKNVYFHTENSVLNQKKRRRRKIVYITKNLHKQTKIFFLRINKFLFFIYILKTCTITAQN